MGEPYLEIQIDSFSASPDILPQKDTIEIAVDIRNKNPLLPGS
jgi:hypothetical protein